MWRMTKDHVICKELHISCIEDLCKGYRETRAALWPKIKEARDAGKRAYLEVVMDTLTDRESLRSTQGNVIG